MSNHLRAQPEMQYETAIACPETLYNCLKAIRARIDYDRSIDSHHIIKVVYSLDFGAPSHRFINILDQYLDQNGYDWRFHSMHINVIPRLVKVLLRKNSLADLTEEDVPVSDHEKNLIPLMTELARVQQRDAVPDSRDMQLPWNYYMLPCPGSLRIFRLPSGAPYYLYRATFDLWEYNGEQGKTWELLTTPPLPTEPYSTEIAQTTSDR